MRSWSWSGIWCGIALSVLDEHLHAPWKPGWSMSTSRRRQVRRKKDLPRSE
jgi:RNA-directed DNA polymerase